MNTYDIRFHGGLLERGFWLYVWRVTEGERSVVYVGRTGDSSSKYASSPFSRIGQHLDLRESAKANTLLRNLRRAGLNPLTCSFELFAVGPLHPEQLDLESHRRIRDLVAPLEAAIAQGLRADGHEVLGTHSRKGLRMLDTAHAKVVEHFRSALASTTGCPPRLG
jgi:hypothetical protein